MLTDRAVRAVGPRGVAAAVRRRAGRREAVTSAANSLGWLMVMIDTEPAAGSAAAPKGARGPVRRAGAARAAELAADLRLVVGRLARSLRQADDGGLTPSQLSALSSIDALGSVRLGDLAAAERVTSPTLTKIVANLEAAGLVQRSADPDDRRAARVSLTAGRAEPPEAAAHRAQRLPPAAAGGPHDAGPGDAGGGHRRADHAGRDGQRVNAGTTSTFASLRQSRNYRLYFGGQAVSLAGTWMQTVAQGWLVLQLTGSSTLLGVVTACQFLPVTFLGPLGGVIVDRFDTRRLLIGTQVAAGVLATLLGVADGHRRGAALDGVRRGRRPRHGGRGGHAGATHHRARTGRARAGQQRRHVEQRQHERGARRGPVVGGGDDRR